MCTQGYFHQQQQHRRSCLHFKALQRPPSNSGHALPQATASQTCAARYLLYPAPSLPVACGPVPACGCAKRFAAALSSSILHCLLTTHRAPDHPPPPCAVPCVITHLKTLNLPACPPLTRGHASENPDLPAALAERNIRFLGPGSVAMAALGDKVRPAPLPMGHSAATAPLGTLHHGCISAALLHRQAS